MGRGAETVARGKAEDTMGAPAIRPAELPRPDQPRRGWGRPWRHFADRHPFLAFLLLGVVLSNGAASVFNILYNNWLIVRHYLDARQQRAFWDVLVPAYNAVAYPVAVAIMVCLLWPLLHARRLLRAGQALPLGQMESCRRRLINLPFYQVCVNFLGWMPGAVVFPLGICLLGGWHNAGPIWLQFALSFSVSALVTTVQTFFLIEALLIEAFYPDFFREARPAEVAGTLRIPFSLRLLLFWSAVALVPLLVLLVVTLNFTAWEDHPAGELSLIVGTVVAASAASGGVISWLVGRSLLHWVGLHEAGTEEIARGNYDVRILEQRPDEWGRLTDHFNDMAAALGRARHLREMFGQFLSPEVRDEILQRPPLGGEVQEVTVLFVDIRGFTRRSAGEKPEHVVDLLNRFFSLAVLAVEGNGGWVNKFLGDGIMALFGVPRPRADHADLAVRAAQELLRRLDQLNRELDREGQEGLAIGAGIHTGPALVGCVGAVSPGNDGRQLVRREYTAIGETVNLGQRLEQLTKHCGGPVLISEQTRARLQRTLPLTCLGPQQVSGFPESLVVYRVEAGRADAPDVSPPGLFAD
jgi:adenylate cyclase